MPTPTAVNTLSEVAPDSTVVASIAPEVTTEPTRLFGIEVDSLEIVEAEVQPNQYLSQILNEYNVSLAMIDRIAKKIPRSV